MKLRDIVIALVIIGLIAGAVFWSQKNQDEELIETPQVLSTEEKLEESFKMEIPEDVDKTELEDVAGVGVSAIATRKYENGQFKLTILADLTDPVSNEFYQAWIQKGNEGDEGHSLISAGKMTLAKGGWILNYQSSADYSDYDKVVVSKEKVFDNIPEEVILNGTF